MRLNSETIAQWTGGRVVGPPVETSGATQDSRVIEAGQLFVPIEAERDGHDFIEVALARGAGAYLSSGALRGGTAIVVGDTMTALASLAREARASLRCPVIGITGSVGKTSTKDLLAGAMRMSRVTHASERSFNNEIGVPLTILNAPDGVEVIVVEMGARGRGHIAELCEIARPTVGVVTAVAEAHEGEFGSMDAIAETKGELVVSLPPSGLAVLNEDDPLVVQMRDRAQAEVLTFGRRPTADVRFVDVSLDDELRPTFTLESPWGSIAARPAVRGAHLVANAAAAAAASLWLGVSLEDVAQGLESAELAPWRMDVVRTSGGGLVINDSYNANPTSMRGALDSLAALDASRKVAVLGYMAELGRSEGRAHEEVAAHARDHGIEVIAVGTDLYGIAPTPIEELGIDVDVDTAVLVKGSRVAGLERFAATLVS